MVGMAGLAVCQFGRRDFRQLPALILPGADCHIGAHDEPRGRCSRIAIITLEIDAGHQTILSSIISTPGIGETPSIGRRSEEHKSELPSLMRNSYAVFCLQNKHI